MGFEDLVSHELNAFILVSGTHQTLYDIILYMAIIQMTESDIQRRQISTSKYGPRTEIIQRFLMAVDP